MLIAQLIILVLSLYLSFCDYKSLSIPLWAFVVCGLLCVGIGFYKQMTDPSKTIILTFFILLSLSVCVYLVGKILNKQIVQIIDLMALPFVAPWMPLESIPVLLGLMGLTSLLSHVVFKKEQVAFIAHLVLSVVLINAWNSFSALTRM